MFCGRLLQHQLYQVNRFDPVVLSAATLALRCARWSQRLCRLAALHRCIRTRRYGQNRTDFKSKILIGFVSAEALIEPITLEF